MAESNPDEDGHLSASIPESNPGNLRDLSLLPDPAPHFVSRREEVEKIRNFLHPSNGCKYVLLHGATGIGKTQVAVKVANEIRKGDDGTLVVYLNCKYISTFEDFAGKIIKQIYQGYPVDDPVAEIKERLTARSDLFYILLLDNFEWLLNQRKNQPVAETAQQKTKSITTLIAEITECSSQVKLLVTSSIDFTFPHIGKELIPLRPFSREESFHLLEAACKGRLVIKEIADKLCDICSGIPLILYTLMSLYYNLAGVVDLMSSCSPEERLELLGQKMDAVAEGDKIEVSLDLCFGRLKREEQATLLSCALIRGWFTPDKAGKIFCSTTSSECKISGRVIELGQCSLLQQQFIGGICRYTFLSVIREYCKNKAKEEKFRQGFGDARNLLIDYFLSFLKDTFKAFLSKDAKSAITDFLREEVNVMQLIEWINNHEMDEERVKKCIDVFNMVGELLAKMMPKSTFRLVFESLKRKCENMGEQGRLSECLTSLGIKEIFNCPCTPGPCSAVVARAKPYLERADTIQTELGIDMGNSRAQCLAKLGRCLAKENDSRVQGREKIEHAIRIRVNAVEAPGPGEEEGGENICMVMLGATYNDMAVAYSLEGNYEQAIRMRRNKALPIYRERLGDHPFTATILNNLSNDYHAQRAFDKAEQYVSEALTIREKLLNDHRDTAKSLFDLGMVLKEEGEFQRAMSFLERCKTMQKKVFTDHDTCVRKTKEELEDVCRKLENSQLEEQLFTQLQ